jgi:hypothetical protein
MQAALIATSLLLVAGMLGCLLWLAAHRAEPQPEHETDTV